MGVGLTLLSVLDSPQTNLLVGRDGAANSNKCSSEYVQSWGVPKVNHSIMLL